MSNRGGKRQGAGRPKGKVNKEPISIRLSPDVITWIDRQKGTRTEVIERAINQMKDEQLKLF